MTSTPIKLSPSNFCPATKISPAVNESVRRIFFARSASLATSYSSSALRLATSLSAAIPFNRDDCRRGRGEEASVLTRFGVGFLGFGAAFGVFGLPNKPADWDSSFSFLRRASRSAIFAKRCFSKSEISVPFSVAMVVRRMVWYGVAQASTVE